MALQKPTKEETQRIFSYRNYNPIEAFEEIPTESQLSALMALIIGLETQCPGTIAYLLTRLSLIDGGFKFQSSVPEASSAHAVQCQKDFLELLLELSSQR